MYSQCTEQLTKILSAGASNEKQYGTQDAVIHTREGLFF